MGAGSFLLEKDESGHGWCAGHSMMGQLLSARLRSEFHATKGKAVSALAVWVLLLAFGFDQTNGSHPLISPY